MHWMTKRKIDAWKKRNKRHINFNVEKPLRCNNDSTTNDNRYEHYQYVGCETDGTMLLIDYKISNGQKEAYLYLKLADGRIFTLPSESSQTQSIKNFVNFMIDIPTLPSHR